MAEIPKAPLLARQAVAMETYSPSGSKTVPCLLFFGHLLPNLLRSQRAYVCPHKEIEEVLVPSVWKCLPPWKMVLK